MCVARSSISACGGDTGYERGERGGTSLTVIFAVHWRSGPPCPHWGEILSARFTPADPAPCVSKLILSVSYFQHASEGTVTSDTASLGAGLCARWQGQLWLPDKSVVWCPPSNRIRGTEASRTLPVLFYTNNSSSRFAVPCIKPVWLFQSLVKAVGGGEGSWGLLFIHSVHHYWINNSSCDGNSSGHILRAYVSNTVLSLCVFSHRAIRLPWGVGMMTLCGDTEIKVKVVLL